MEQQHRILINQYIEELTLITYDVEKVVDKLFEKNVINQWIKDYILDYLLNDTQKLQRLYELIQGRGPLAFGALCKALEETKNLYARRLLRAPKNIKSDEKSKGLKSINSNNGREEPYIKIHPDRKRMDVNDESGSTGVYHMGSNPKGHAFILNINKTVGRDERHGSNVDFTSLNRLFVGLGYVVQSKEDLTKTETIEAIEEFIDNCQNKKIDSIVVFIMSHGEAGKDSTRSSDILTADGYNINTDWLIEKFGSDKISKNIPKLFFIQACRGENSDFGHLPVNIHNNVLQNDCNSFSVNGASSSVGSIINRRYENVFIAYATVPGYNAKRHPINGSWFVQTLCKVFRNKAGIFDLDSLMRMVDQEVKSMNCIINGFQTVEWSYRGFNKKFFFNPGLYDDNSSIDISTNIFVNPTNTEE